MACSGVIIDPLLNVYDVETVIITRQLQGPDTLSLSICVSLSLHLSLMESLYIYNSTVFVLSALAWHAKYENVAKYAADNEKYATHRYIQRKAIQNIETRFNSISFGFIELSILARTKIEQYMLIFYGIVVVFVIIIIIIFSFNSGIVVEYKRTK